jgi:hypothetical protein
MEVFLHSPYTTACVDKMISVFVVFFKTIHPRRVLDKENYNRFSRTLQFIYSSCSTMCFGPAGHHQVSKNGRFN